MYLSQKFTVPAPPSLPEAPWGQSLDADQLSSRKVRPVVDQVHLHVGAETPGRHLRIGLRASFTRCSNTVSPCRRRRWRSSDAVRCGGVRRQEVNCETSSKPPCTSSGTGSSCPRRRRTPVVEQLVQRIFAPQRSPSSGSTRPSPTGRDRWRPTISPPTSTRAAPTSLQQCNRCAPAAGRTVRRPTSLVARTSASTIPARWRYAHVWMICSSLFGQAWCRGQALSRRTDGVAAAGRRSRQADGRWLSSKATGWA